MTSSTSRKTDSRGRIAHESSVPIFGTQHVFNEFKRDGSQVHIGLNESVVDGLSGIGFQQLAFELKIADRHDQVLSWQFSREETKKGSRFGCFSETTRKTIDLQQHSGGGLLQEAEFPEDHELSLVSLNHRQNKLTSFPSRILCAEASTMSAEIFGIVVSPCQTCFLCMACIGITSRTFLLEDQSAPAF